MAQLRVFYLERDLVTGDLDETDLGRFTADREVTAWRAYPAAAGAALWLVVEGARAVPKAALRAAGDLAERLHAADRPLFDGLRAWRATTAKALGWPAYRVATTAALASIAALRPHTPDELDAVPGVGPATVERFGPDLLGLVAGAG